MAWRDVIAKAPTGTGKTCAFGFPIIEHLEDGRHGIQALILSPTRELAIQISEDIGQLASSRPAVKVVTLTAASRSTARSRSCAKNRRSWSPRRGVCSIICSGAT